ncbi:MAG: sulfite exporter TauE/SafE family protein [Aeoliella sp.]
MEVFGYAAAILTGMALGLLGAGGSVLTMPTLVYLFGVEPVLATAYSLFVVGLTALGGASGYFRRGWIDFRAVVGFGVPSIVGVIFARRYVIPSLPDSLAIGWGISLTKDSLIMVAFALLMLGAGFAMVRDRSERYLLTDDQSLSRRSSAWHFLVAAEGLVVGLITGIVGAGGGFLIVPGLVLLVGLPVRKAIGSSLTIIAAKSLLGSANEIAAFSSVEWGFLLKFCLATSVGMGIGIGLTRFVSPHGLRKSFGALILFMGATILASEFLQ